MGQGEGEGRSRSGARVADDSSVSSKCSSRFLGCWKRVGGGVDSEQTSCYVNFTELKIVLRSMSSHTGRLLVIEVTDPLGREADNATSGSITTD